jgi:hypothetical protein
MRGGNQKETHILAFKGENNKTKNQKKETQKGPSTFPHNLFFSFIKLPMTTFPFSSI